MCDLTLVLHIGDAEIPYTNCLSAALEAEVYTPYAKLTAVYAAQAAVSGTVSGISLYADGSRVFFGIADSVQQIRRGGGWLVRVRSRSFTSVLAQNELVPGLHTDMTLERLMTGFYEFPHVAYEPYAGSGYIYVKDGTSLWDSIVHFGYKLTGRYPYIRGNTVRLTLPDEPLTAAPPAESVLEYGIVQNTEKLISTYHMADISENYDAYQLDNAAAAEVQIVRHRQLLLDRQYLYDPEQALQFRCRYSCRGWQADTVTYSGYSGEQLGDRVSFGNVQNVPICRLRMHAGKDGIRTTLWSYRDGFYSTAT